MTASPSGPLPTDAPDARSHPHLAALLDYWLSIEPPGRLPGRQHLDPLDLPRPLLPWLYLLDVVPRQDGAPHFRFRLIGTALVEKFERDSTGRRFDELYEPEAVRRMEVGLRRAIAEGRPVAAERSMPVRGREFLRFKRLICPLAADGETVDMTIGVHGYNALRR